MQPHLCTLRELIYHQNLRNSDQKRHQKLFALYFKFLVNLTEVSLNKHEFSHHASSLIPVEFRNSMLIFQNNLSAILRFYNYSHEIQNEKLASLSKETSELIFTAFPCACITHSFHKLLALSTILILECNNGYGLK